MRQLPPRETDDLPRSNNKTQTAIGVSQDSFIRNYLLQQKFGYKK